MNINTIAAEALSGGQSTKHDITASASTAALSLPTGHPKGVPVKCLLTLDAAGFIRKGTGDVTAVADGTDQYVPANTPFRVELMEGEKIAAIAATGAGNMYFTPGA